MNIPKFRAWHKDFKKMVQVEMLDLEERRIIFPSRSESMMLQYGWPFEDIELMQSSGLVDGEGNEIYTNDIVEHENGYKFTIEYCDGAFFVCNDKLKSAYLLYSGNERLKIVGNIFEENDHIANAGK